MNPGYDPIQHNELTKKTVKAICQRSRNGLILGIRAVPNRPIIVLRHRSQRHYIRGWKEYKCTNCLRETRLQALDIDYYFRQLCHRIAGIIYLYLLDDDIIKWVAEEWPDGELKSADKWLSNQTGRGQCLLRRSWVIRDMLTLLSQHSAANNREKFYIIARLFRAIKLEPGDIHQIANRIKGVEYRLPAPLKVSIGGNEQERQEAWRSEVASPEFRRALAACQKSHQCDAQLFIPYNLLN